MNAYDIIIQPWLTEKSMEARTTEQRLEFIVRKRCHEDADRPRR